MKYSVSEDTAAILDTLRELEQLTDKVSKIAEKHFGEEYAHDFSENKLFPIAADYRKAIDSLLIENIEDQLMLNGESCEI